jgi:hypothetical protein
MMVIVNSAAVAIRSGLDYNAITVGCCQGDGTVTDLCGSTLQLALHDTLLLLLFYH